MNLNEIYILLSEAHF